MDLADRQSKYRSKRLFPLCSADPWTISHLEGEGVNKWLKVALEEGQIGVSMNGKGAGGDGGVGSVTRMVTLPSGKRIKTDIPDDATLYLCLATVP